MRSLTLRKGAHTYVFRYAPGSECDILQAVADMAGEADNNFDWFDAASLSFQVTCEQASQCLRVIESPTPEV